MPLWRSQLTNVYHYCSRCGFRQPLSMMRWQNGQLFCSPTDCLDTAVVGTRDLAVARELSIDRRELEADPKLTTPHERRNTALEVQY